MRIYNGTKSALSLPLSGTTRINVAPNSVSGDVLVSTDFLSLLVASYDYSQVALIVSGHHELSQCAKVPSASGFVVQSLDDAVAKFAPKDNPKPIKTKIEVKAEEIIEEVKEVAAEVVNEAKEVVEEAKEAIEETAAVTKTTTKKVVESVKIKAKKAKEALVEEETKIDEAMATGEPIISDGE